MPSPFFKTFDPDLEAALALIETLDTPEALRAALQVPPASTVSVHSDAGFAIPLAAAAQRHPARALVEFAASDPVAMMANMILADHRAGRETTEARLAVFFTRAEIERHKGAARALAIEVLGGIKHGLANARAQRAIDAMGEVA